ncbi:hypothetical protein ACVMIH_000055 [Bradyrhizobium sp. USDA 4503]
MKHLHKLLAVASAAFFLASSALAQNSGAVTNHAFAIGKGPGTTGYASLLCTSAQLAVGQAAADPICRTMSGDATLSAAGALTLATVNSNVGSFGSATNCTTITVNAKGLITAASQTTCTPAVGSITGLGTGVATALGIATNGAGGFVTSPVANANLATMAANTVKANGTAGVAAPTDIACPTGGVVGRNGSSNVACQLIVDANVFSSAAIATTKIAFGTGVATASANALNASGGLVGFSGALGTPTSGTLTNATGLPLSGLTTQAANTLVANATGSSASPTAVDISTLTSKASPGAGDYVLLSDQAAAGALKKATVSSIASAGSVASIDAKTGSFTTGNGIDTTAGNVIELTAARRTLPTTQVFTSGSGTYNTPANVQWIRVTLIGGGGGGQASGTSAGAGSAGGATCWNTSGAACTAPFASATGGGGNSGAAVAGGSWTGSCNLTTVNGGGGQGNANVQSQGGMGGSSTMGGGGAGAQFGNTSAPLSGGTNTGGGGGGATATTGNVSGGGGGAGGTCKFVLGTPAASYTYTVGAGGTGGTAGGSGAAGGAGAAGYIIVEEFYNS